MAERRPLSHGAHVAFAGLARQQPLIRIVDPRSAATARKAPTMGDNFRNDLRYGEVDLYLREQRAAVEEIRCAQRVARAHLLSMLVGRLLLWAGGMLTGAGNLLLQAGATLIGEAATET
jgi:hypothetical protein